MTKTSKPNKFKLSELVKTVKAIIQSRPDVIYSTILEDGLGACYYSKGKCSDGTLGCVFGQAFQAMGFKIPSANDSDSINSIIENFAVGVTQRQQDMCEGIQDWQDKENTWKTSLDMANKQLRSKYGR